MLHPRCWSQVSINVANPFEFLWLFFIWVDALIGSVSMDQGQILTFMSYLPWNSTAHMGCALAFFDVTAYVNILKVLCFGFLNIVEYAYTLVGSITFAILGTHVPLQSTTNQERVSYSSFASSSTTVISNPHPLSSKKNPQLHMIEKTSSRRAGQISKQRLNHILQIIVAWNKNHVIQLWRLECCPSLRMSTLDRSKVALDVRLDWRCRQALRLRVVQIWGHAWAFGLPTGNKHYSPKDPISWFFYFLYLAYFFGIFLTKLESTTFI